MLREIRFYGITLFLSSIYAQPWLHFPSVFPTSFTVSSLELKTFTLSQKCSTSLWPLTEQKCSSCLEKRFFLADNQTDNLLNVAESKEMNTIITLQTV